MVLVPSSPLFANDFPLTSNVAKQRPKVRASVADVTVGAAAGATATAPRTQVKHSSNATAKDGGKMEFEVVNDINRATTAQDVADLKAEFGPANRAPFTFPADRSGNGGRAFTRSF